jgi:LmbE family N-acetylglucosaminyl deacetylase
MKRVLAFGCHPDDVEFQCAGTLALLARRGYEIHIATMTGGELGTAEHSLQEIRAIRLKEAAKAAAVIGAKFHYAGGYDLAVEYSGEYRRYAVRVMREVDPFLVFTHPPVDYHVDHEETSKLVRVAAFAAPIPNFDCHVPTRVASGVPYLYYWNAWGNKDHFGRPLPLGLSVEISSMMKVKAKMLACHASQRNWMRHHHHVDHYIEVMKSDAKAEGKRAGLKAAEGFIQHRGSSYPQDNVLKTILKNLCVEF